VLVLISHCYGAKDPLLPFTGGGSNIAMPVFFFLSGLLVAQSLEVSSSRINFLWKRFLRLYPAACFVILVSAFLIGPLLTTLPLRDYFSHPLFFQYLSSCSLFNIYYFLPGTLEHSRFGPSINPALWSLSLELKLYLLLALTSFIPGKYRIQLTITTILILLITGAFSYTTTEEWFKRALWPHFVLYPYTWLGVFFLIGNLCYYFRDRIIIRNYWLPLGILCWWAGFHFLFSSLAVFCLIPALVLYFGANKPAWMDNVIPRPDLSYGLYVWGGLAQQLVDNYLHPNNPTGLFLLVLVFGIGISILSWFVIESPALRLKTKRATPIRGSLDKYY
jgi:peptidoglycan/LPS O-acetylase OafA/YrhL